MIVIERMEPDGLKGRLWHFMAFASHNAEEIEVRPRLYAETERPSTRHKFKITRKWDSFDERPYYSDIKREEVPLPPDVVREAINRVKVTVTFGPRVGRQ